MNDTTTPARAVALLMGDKENAARASVPFGIEAQEMDGQSELVTRDMLPRLLRPNREAFERVGFVFGKFIDGLFLEAKMPSGWLKKATEGALHSELLDEQGRRRGTLFYDAAFHNRNAYASLVCRYGIRSCDVDGDEKLCELAVWDYADGRVIHSAGLLEARESARVDELRTAASYWLNQHFPDYQDPLAYW